MLLSSDGKTSLEFLSTPSARRATQMPLWMPARERISIHALREEGDAQCRPSPDS